MPDLSNNYKGTPEGNKKYAEDMKQYEADMEIYNKKVNLQLDFEKAEAERTGLGKDLERGAEITSGLVDKYADGAFDRVQDSAFYKEGVTSQRDIIAQKREQAKGMSSAEMQLQQGRSAQKIRGTTQANIRGIAAMQNQMGLGTGGGGTAAAQRMQAMFAGQNAQSNLTQNLMMQQRQMQAQGLAGQEASQGALTAAQGKAFSFDVGTASNRLNMIGMGAANLAGIQSTERIADVQAAASVKAAKAGKTSSGGTAVCTVANEYGYLPDDILKADGEYGLKNMSSDCFRGYHSFAIPLANLARKYKWVIFLCLPFVRGWAYHMAYLEGVYPKSNIIGKAIHKLGVPVCEFIGRLLRRK